MYSRLMTSFGRVVDADPLVSGPARALAERVVSELPAETAAVDARLYSHATEHHLRLLAGAWVMAREGSVPQETAEIFEEAIAWRLGPVTKHGARLAHRTAELARGLAPRDLSRPEE